MELLPNAAHGFHLVRNVNDPPPFYLPKPKGRTERSRRPAGRRRRANDRPKR